MRLYIIRHGETDWNAERKMQGQHDIALNENGRQAAIDCGKALKDTPFDRIYCSPLIRAKETAELIRGDRELEIVVEERLIELHFGALEGVSPTSIVTKEMETQLQNFFRKPAEYKPLGGGEAIEEACDRTDAFLADLRQNEASDASILIVAHGAINKALQLRPLGRGVNDFWGGGVQTNCSVTILEEQNGAYTLVSDAAPLLDGYTN